LRGISTDIFGFDSSETKFRAKMRIVRRKKVVTREEYEVES
jgi:hypothetical protein